MGFGSKLGLVLGFWGNQTIAPKEDCPRLGLGFGLGLVLRLWGNFFWGAIVLEPVHQIRSLHEVLQLKQNFKAFPGKIPFFVIGTFCIHHSTHLS